MRVRFSYGSQPASAARARVSRGRGRPVAAGPPWAVRAPAGLTAPDREAAVMGLPARLVRGARAARVRVGGGGPRGAHLRRRPRGQRRDARTAAPRRRACPRPSSSSPGWLGRPHRSAPWTRIMTEAELGELRATGVEIGAHSRLPSGSEHALVRGRSGGARRQQDAARGCARRARRGGRVPLRPGERGNGAGVPRRRVPRCVLGHRARLLERSAQPAPAGHGEPLDA